MLSYHNDPAVKARYVQRFEQHRAADEVIQGTGFDNGRGCFVGCTLDSYAHDRFPIELGWPTWLAHLADAIFEDLPKADAPQFGSELLEAVPVGVDLDPIRAEFLLSVQTRSLARLQSNEEPYADGCRKAIQGVIDWLAAGGRGEAARAAAESAAKSATCSALSAAQSAESAAWSAWSAAESAAWSAAESAAKSAAWAALSAAQSAAQSAAESSESSELAELAEFQWQREALLNLIRASSSTATILEVAAP